MLTGADAQDFDPPGSLVDLSVRFGGHGAVSLTVDVHAEAQTTAFALSLRKSGSSLFSNMVNAIALAAGRNVVDIPAAAFAQNIRYRDWNVEAELRQLIWSGNIYTGFRDPPTALCGDPVFEQATKLLLLRDPRDVLVSEYFSNAYSHSLPEKGAEESVIASERKIARDLEIESYVLNRVDALNNTIRLYRPLLGDARLQVLKYEDVIFDKPGWIRQIAAAFELPLGEKLIEDIVGWADIRPAVEDATSFVRRVTPGDHQEKLSPETIAKVENELDSIWWDLGYARSDL